MRFFPHPSENSCRGKSRLQSPQWAACGLGCYRHTHLLSAHQGDLLGTHPPVPLCPSLHLAWLTCRDLLLPRFPGILVFFWGGGRAPSVTAKIRPSAIVNSPAMPQPPSKRTRSPPGRSGWGPAGPNRRRELAGAGGSGRQLDASGESLCLCIKGAETSGPTLSCSPEQRRVLWMRQLACSSAAAETPRVEGPLENRTHSSGRLGVLQNEPELFRKPNHFSF